MTFLDLYRMEGEKPTPRQAFIAEVARVTKKAETTVKQWVRGMVVPDELTIDTLAKHFNCDPDSLFPNRLQKQP